ncbi:MAG: triose-phosphate isomerase, partial [Planctomycetota bacterium]
MRRAYVAGNWKMNLDRRAAQELAAAVRDHRAPDGVDVGLFPAMLHVDEVARACASSAVRVGGQNCSDETSGAFTGEISATMLKDVGCAVVLLGHSERRHVYGETDAFIARKVRRALDDGLDVMLCVGETIEERRDGRTEEVCKTQLMAGLDGVTADEMARVSVAYEPVWAIGTGETATPEQAGSVHAYLRGLVAGGWSDPTAAALRILYGGSVKPANAAELMAVPDIDGALVGGASLRPDTFLPII